MFNRVVEVSFFPSNILACKFGVGLGMWIHVDNHPPTYFLRWGLSVNLELIVLGWLASKPLRNAPVSPQ